MGGEANVSVGTVLDRVKGHELAVCPYCRGLLCSVGGSSREFHVWNSCSLDKGHCDFGGVRLKFVNDRFGFLRVVWICPRLVGLPREV
jgi:hypothetical protein